jgi:hypothetical protein
MCRMQAARKSGREMAEGEGREAVRKVYDILRVFTARDARFQSMLVSYFTIDGRMVPVFEKHLMNLVVEGSAWHPYACTLAKAGGGKLRQFKTIVCAASPNTLLHAAQYDLGLPTDGNYLLFCSPVISEGEATNDAIAKDTIRMALGLLIAFAGKGAVLTYIGDELVRAGKTETSIIGEVIRIVHPIDTIVFGDSKIVMKDVLEALKVMDAETKAPLLYCLTLFGRAVSEPNDTFRFTLYSIALELIAGGKKGKEFTRRLAEVYGERSGFARDNLETRTYIRFRDRLMHQGMIETLDSKMERLLQCYFIELLRDRLGLPCERLTAGMLEAMAKAKP